MTRDLSHTRLYPAFLSAPDDVIGLSTVSLLSPPTINKVEGELVLTSLYLNRTELQGY